MCPFCSVTCVAYIHSNDLTNNDIIKSTSFLVYIGSFLLAVYSIPSPICRCPIRKKFYQTHLIQDVTHGHSDIMSRLLCSIKSIFFDRFCVAFWQIAPIIIWDIACACALNVHCQILSLMKAINFNVNITFMSESCNALNPQSSGDPLTNVDQL